MVALQFGSFNRFCDEVALIVCPLVGDKIEPQCYARNIEINGTLIFQPGKPIITHGYLWIYNLIWIMVCLFLSSHYIATLVVHVVALIMTAIMIFHIKSKYTAVGKLKISYMETIDAQFILWTICWTFFCFHSILFINWQAERK